MNIASLLLLLQQLKLVSARPSQRTPSVNSDVVDNFHLHHLKHQAKPSASQLLGKKSKVHLLRASVQQIPRRKYATCSTNTGRDCDHAQSNVTIENNDTTSTSTKASRSPSKGGYEELIESTIKKGEGRRFFEQETEIDIESYLGPEMTWPIDNNLFQGSLCILIRDHPRCDYNFDNETDVYFELQIQGKFKRKPTGPIYLGLELPEDEKINISWPLRTFLNAAVAFMKSWGYKSVNLSFGRGEEIPPQISSPAFQAFDRIVITPNGETPPRLGHAIPECNENTVKRKSLTFDHRICTNSIYTLSLNHTYVDLVEWQVHGIPVVNSFEFTFTDSMRLVMYEVDDDSVDTKGNINAVTKKRNHKKRDVVFWIKFEREMGQK